MTARIILAGTHHDPGALMLDQLRRVGSTLFGLYAASVVTVTRSTPDEVRDALRDAGAIITDQDDDGDATGIGTKRQSVVAEALALGADAVHLCDLDRALHWAEMWPGELAALLPELAAADFTVLGRTPRAFQSHPLPQRDTERIINQVFAQLSGKPWDVTGASRGLSAKGAAWITANAGEPSIGVDTAWPLLAQRSGSLTLAYRETEGLEFETADRYEWLIELAGGFGAWFAWRENDLGEWRYRTRMLDIEVMAALRAAQRPG